MKMCPLCGTSYVDESISYCLADGSSLVATADEQATAVRSGAAPIRVDIPQPIPAANYIPQPQYVSATPAAGGLGSVVKVLLAAALVLFLLLAVMGAAGVLIYLNSGTRESASGGAVPTPTPAAFSTMTPVAAVSPAINSSPTPSSSVTPPQTPPPGIDKVAALRDVFEIENVIIRSTFKGDIAALESNTTDDFTSTDAQGRNFNKRQMIAEIRKGEARNYVYKLGKPTLVSADESTVVFRYQLQAGPPQSEYDRVTLTETYVKRDGRWLLRSQKAGGR